MYRRSKMRNTISLPSWSSVLVILFSSIFLVLGEERSIFIVLLQGKGGALQEKGRGGDRNMSNIHTQKIKTMSYHDMLLESNLDAGSYHKLYSFHHLINGFAVHTTGSQVGRLREVEGVRLIEKDRGIRLMTTYTPTFLGLPAGAWEREGGVGIAGEGIVIGVVDTGINPAHPSFANDAANPFLPNIPRFTGACETGPRFPESSCNGKIISARYFSAGATALMPLNASMDFLSPFDATGHGSHVASVAAGNSGVQVIVDEFNYGTASGMAPRARIAVYKAVYPDISTLADVLAAIDQATQDGVDILSLSVGPDEPPQESPVTMLSAFDVMLMFAQRAGIVVVQAAGNNGPSARTVISFSPWVMGVASCSTDRSYTPHLLLGNSLSVPGIGLSASTLGEHKLVSAKDAAVSPNITTVEECQKPETLVASMVRGSILLCSFSAGFLEKNSTIYAVRDTAKTLGAAGFVLAANPLYGDFVVDPIPFSIPGIMIPRVSHVQILMKYYEEQIQRENNTGATLSFGASATIKTGREASFHEKESPIVSRFSSRGPGVIDARLTPADILKPDILAPGHVIWGAWSPMSMKDPLLKGYSFVPLSGTSMATPHVAGIAALIKELHPTWTPAMVASALVTTALKYDHKRNPILAEGPYGTGNLYPATPFDYGAGLVNALGSLDPGLVFKSEFEDYVSFLCSLPNMDAQVVAGIVHMNCSSALAHPSDLNLPSITISALGGSRSVRRWVTNVASRTETYLCSVLPPKGVEVQVLPSYFSIDPQGAQDLEIRVNVSRASEEFSFGQIVLVGSLDHIVRLSLTVFTTNVL